MSPAAPIPTGDGGPRAAARRPSRPLNEETSDMTVIEAVVEQRMLVDGEDVEALSGERFTRESPAHDIAVASYPQGGAADVDRAVQAARRAFDAGPWPRMSGAERAQGLVKTAGLIRRDAAELARIE